MRVSLCEARMQLAPRPAFHKTALNGITMNGNSPISRPKFSTQPLGRSPDSALKCDSSRDLTAEVPDYVGTSVRTRITEAFYCLCFWISLPLSIWLSSGWVGLLLNLQNLPAISSPFEARSDLLPNSNL